MRSGFAGKYEVASEGDLAAMDVWRSSKRGSVGSEDNPWERFDGHLSSYEDAKNGRKDGVLVAVGDHLTMAGPTTSGYRVYGPLPVHLAPA